MASTVEIIGMYNVRTPAIGKSTI